MSHSDSCPICGHKELFSDRANLLRCESCLLVFDRNIWKPFINEEFEQEWFEGNWDMSRSFWTDIFESWKNERTWKLVEKYHSPKGKLLEIGVGSGLLLKFMKNKGFEVEGCDLSKTICEYVKKTYVITMHNQMISELSRDLQYDVIIMNHVLEHVNDPVEFLRQVKVRLKNDGILHIAVPNIECWEARLPGWNSYEPYHLLYFSQDSLRHILEKSGFAVVKMSTHDSFSGWFLSIIRTLLKTYQISGENRKTQKNRYKTSLVRCFYRTVMVICGAISLPLRWIQSKIGAGDEIIVIAQPKGKKVIP